MNAIDELLNELDEHYNDPLGMVSAARAEALESREELRQAYALGIYKGTDGLLRNSWQQQVEELKRENERLKGLLNEANKQAWHDRM